MNVRAGGQREHVHAYALRVERLMHDAGLETPGGGR